MVKTRFCVLTLVCRCARKSGAKGETKRTRRGRDGESGKFKRAKTAVTRILYGSSSGFIRLEEAFACLPVCPIELHANARTHARHTHTYTKWVDVLNPKP